MAIKVGGIYLYTPADITQQPQSVMVKRLYRGGLVDVVGEMNGVWMRHGWRCRLSRLTRIDTQ